MMVHLFQRYSLRKQNLTRLHYITLGTYDYVLSLEMFRLACIVAPWLLIHLHWGWVAHQEPPLMFLMITISVESQCLSFTLLTAVGGTNIIPHHTNICKFSKLCLAGSYIFVRLRRVTFKFGNFTNFKALFQVMTTDFPELIHVKSWKNHRRFLFICYTCRLHAWSIIQEKMTR